VKCALGEKEGDRPPDEQGVGLPRRQGVDQAFVEKMAGALGEGGTYPNAVPEPAPNNTAARRREPPRGTATMAPQAAAMTTVKDDPGLPRRVGMPEARVGRTEEEGHAARDDHGGADVPAGVRRWSSQPSPAGAKTRLSTRRGSDEDERFPPAAPGIEQVADPSRSVAHIATSVGGPDGREGRPVRQLPRLADRRVVLEDGGQAVGRGTAIDSMMMETRLRPM